MDNISWKDKRCPKCGSAVDVLETCRKCGRTWTPELDKDEQGNVVEPAIGLDEGMQFESVVKKVGKRKARKSRFTKTKAELAGKKFKVFSNDLPDQFKEWQIKESDSEAEIIRKRSLMRLDSRKIYNQMGLSVRAQENSKAALLWLSKLWEFLEPDEQAAIEPAMKCLKVGFDTLTMVRQSKIAQATKMEKAMEKAHQQARKARIKAAEDQKKNASKVPPPGQESEGLGLTPVALDPLELLQQAKEKLLKLEKAKHEQSTGNENPFESE